VKNRQFALLLGVIIASLAFVFSACKKLNEATELGGDLIPAVDNITTFETTLPVETYNDIFALANDSTRSFDGDEHFLGRITSDPIFGATDAELYLELKPSFYPFSFKNVNIPPTDSLFIDSVVLVLDYLETYGDTTIPQLINVYEITDPSFKDSTYFVNRTTFATGALLGFKAILPFQLKDSVKAYLDTTKSQLRIPLSNAFGQRLLDYDSAAGEPYHDDAAFHNKFKGFALKSEGGGNAIMGFDLLGANTKLAIYYRYQKGGPGIANQDTTVDYFNFTTVAGSANYIKRTHSGVVTAASGAAQDPLLYIQNSPGTFAKIRIPGLDTMSNKLIHRAELIMEQVGDPSDTLFPHPGALMLDASDPSISTSVSKFRTIPYDFQSDGTGSFNLGPFGAAPQNILDPSGKVVKVWKFNISRYVQHVLTHTISRYDLRVFAPYFANEQYGIPPNGTDLPQLVNVNSSYGKGRVRLGGGNHPTQKMRLRIIYSKI
jgi:Domain of unknown function (DUF4270)